jgi:hypothetical protein
MSSPFLDVIYLPPELFAGAFFGLIISLFIDNASSSYFLVKLSFLI